MLFANVTLPLYFGVLYWAILLGLALRMLNDDMVRLVPTEYPFGIR